MTSFVPITSEAFGGKSWRKFSDYKHASGDAFVPLLAKELPLAQQSLVVAFAESGQGMTPIAVLGVGNGKSLYVAPNGTWVEQYVPAQLRAYPFRMATLKDGQQVLCFNQDSDLICDEGTPFFTDDGEVSEDLKSILSFLQQIEAARELTERICKAIDDAGLLTPWDINIKVGEATQKLGGLFRIDEEKFLALSGDELKSLADVGAFPTIYAQLMSMQNISKLQTLIRLHDEHAGSLDSLPQNDAGELDLEFLKSDDTIKF